MKVVSEAHVAHFIVSLLRMGTTVQWEEVIDVFKCWLKFSPYFGASKNDLDPVLVFVQ